jgi:S-DNA-T family DNA segregation ATPase FtsK/SpoIIIE
MVRRRKKKESFISQHSNQIFGVSSLLLGFFLTISLLSYNPLDPSFNLAFDNDISNWGGRLGAFIASPILQALGLGAVFLVITLFTWGWRLVQNRQADLLIMRFNAALIGIFGIAVILAAMPTPSAWYFISLGGFVGHYLFERFIANHSFFLSFSLLLIVSIAAFSIANFVSMRVYQRFFRKVSIMAKRKFIHLKSVMQEKAIMFYEKTKYALLKRFKKNRLQAAVANDDAPSSQEKIAKITKEFDSSLKVTKNKNFELPSVDILKNVPISKKKNDAFSKDTLARNSKILEKTFEDFGIKGKITNVKPGPVVTLYELEPSAGTKSSRIIGLADDVARSMSATSARIAVIPGRNALGIELPNETREVVYLRNLFKAKEYRDEKLKLPLALGDNIGGEPVMADLTKMPHLLVAGTTGSGKSVAINTMILSLLYRLSPDECKFIMIDPKMLELSAYEGIPHLLSPVVVDPKKAVVALRWTVREMENRYRLMSSLGVRSIEGYNNRIKEAIAKKEVLTRKVHAGFNEETGKPIITEVELDMTTLPFIVVIIDEMADLMLVAGKEIEAYIQRLAQMARAAGIHIITATQRPSVDVITGVIKANFPTRISFQVTSKIDSRTILGEQGAEQLLGMGDMLYMLGGTRVIRVHGPFVSDKEVQQVVSHLKKQGKPSYVEDVLRNDEEGGDEASGDSGEVDELYDQAVNIVLKDRKVSTSYIQRQLKIGYNRAANIVDKMESEGVVSSPTATGRREVLSGS